jgi:hypothetical protein
VIGLIGPARVTFQQARHGRPKLREMLSHDLMHDVHLDPVILMAKIIADGDDARPRHFGGFWIEVQRVYEN